MTSHGRLLIAAVALVALPACGSGGAGSEVDAAAVGDGGGGGSTTVTTAPTVPDADVRTGEFELLPTRPADDYDDVAGTSVLERSVEGTFLEIALQGLPPGGHFMAHLHEGTCAENGGPHYKFDPAGGDDPPNEVHLHFESDSEGTAEASARNDTVADERAQTVVVHPHGEEEQMFACATFEATP